MKYKYIIISIGGTQKHQIINTDARNFNDPKVSCSYQKYRMSHGFFLRLIHVPRFFYPKIFHLAIGEFFSNLTQKFREKRRVNKSTLSKND